MTNAPISDPYKINPYQWPIINPGNSWAMPRIALPQFFSIQWAFAIDSWYYIRHGIDDQENEYSLDTPGVRPSVLPAQSDRLQGGHGKKSLASIRTRCA
jgi:hypothetical protein